MTRKRVRISLGLLLLVGLLAAAALALAPQCLLIETPCTQADVIILLGGGTNTRPARAAELFRQGVASRVIVSGEGDTWVNWRLLTNAGVPPSAILLEPASRTTWQNAQFSTVLLRSNRFHRAAIVTSWFHSRRALACFRKVAPDCVFFSCPTVNERPRPWTLLQPEFYRVFREYAKTAWYWVRYSRFANPVSPPRVSPN